MAALLPITAQGAQFSVVTELDSVAYSFDFRWNHRDSGWYLTLGDAEGTPLAHGIRVVLGPDLLAMFPGREGFPAGVLVAVDSSGQELEAAQDDLGSRVKLYYLSPADLA
jgi:hypothetical protein